MPEEVASSFWGHIDELAKRLKVVLFVLLLSTIIMLFLPANLNFFQDINDYQPWVSTFLRAIRERVLPPDVKLIALQMTDPITLYVIAGFAFSVGISMPVIAYEVYKFVDPALHPNERKAIYPFITAVSTLFIAGATFGFFILFPFFIISMFPFFAAVGAEMIFSLMDFYNVFFLTVVSSGLVFTFPAFFVLLVKFGILHTDTFRRSRKYVYAALIIAAMFISPGASPQGDLLLFLVMSAIFEISILVARRYEKKGITPIGLFSSNPTCRFCNAKLTENSTFCPQCKRSQE